jgi:proline iminopeptidase
MATFQRRMIDVGDATLETFSGGGSPPLVCTAHNFDVTGEHGGLAMEALARTAPTVAVNLRAMGGSSGAADPALLSMAQAVRDLESVRRALGIERWIFFGYSAGGFIGLQYALAFPDALRGLILCATAPSYRVFFDPASIYCRDNPSFATVQSVAGTQRWAEVVWPLIAHRPELVAAASAHGAGLSSERQAAQIAEMRGYDVEPRLGEIAIPTLVVHGRHDASMPVSQGEAIAAAIPGSELAIMEASGHFPFWEEPAAFEAVVRGFVTRLTER